MEPLGDAGAVGRRIGAVRRARGWSSNLYAAPDQLDRWAAAGTLAGLEAERAALVLRADRDFHHLFHVAEDQPALRAALARLPAGTFVADLVGRDAALDEVCATYAAAGFVPHATLIRLVRTQASGDEAAGGEGTGAGAEAGDGAAATVATVADAPAVAALLDRLLDRFAEQVPDAAELEREAAAGRLLLVRRAGAVAGMLLYDLKGQGAQLRFWHVDAHAQGQGVGRVLMRAFLARCAAARRLVLWVLADNDRSIAIYRHYGFAPDGLADRIMILRQERQP